MENRKQRIESVVFFKAFCILGVLGVHSTSRVVADLPADSTLYEFFHWINRLSKFGTPLFIFISAFIYFYAYGRDPSKLFDWKRFAISRVHFVLIPFLIFSTFYYVLKRVVYPIDLSWSDQLITFAGQLVTGKTYTHLYYILVALQFYLIFALVIEPLRQRRHWLKWLFPATLGAHLLLLVLNNQFQWVEAKGSLFISYISYFGLGAWLGTYLTEITDWWKQTDRRNRVLIRSGVFLLAATGAIAFTMMWHKINAPVFKQYSLWIEFSSLLYFLPMGLILYAVSDWFSGRSGKLSNGLRLVGEVSFGIYLIHPMMLMLYRSLPLPHGAPVGMFIWVGGGYMFALLASIGLILGLRKMLGKLSQFSIGSMPQKETQKPADPLASEKEMRTKAS